MLDKVFFGMVVALVSSIRFPALITRRFVHPRLRERRAKQGRVTDRRATGARVEKAVLHATEYEGGWCLIIGGLGLGDYIQPPRFSFGGSFLVFVCRTRLRLLFDDRDPVDFAFCPFCGARIERAD